MFFSPMDLAVLHLGALTFAALLLIWGAVKDVRSFKIPNSVSLGLIALFPIYVLSAPNPLPLWYHLAVFGGLITLGFLLFARNLIGAGDAKFLAALGLWAGPHYLGPLLLVTALMGGVLALALGVRAYLKNRKGAPSEKQDLRKLPVPYGVALAVGGLAVFMELVIPLFPNAGF